MATLLQLIRALAEPIGGYAAYRTTSAGTTTTLVSTQLVSSMLSPTVFEGATALLEDGPLAGQERSVRPSGLDRSTGTLTVAEAFSSAVPSGTTFSLYERMPALTRFGGPSLQKAINEALTLIPVEREVAFDGVSEQLHYAVDPDTYPWWTSPEQIIKVMGPVTSADDVPYDLDRGRWDWRATGDTRQLVFRGGSFRTGESFTVDVYGPANSYLKKDATATASISGGAVVGIAVATGGQYLSAPTVTISGGGGTGATATATLTDGAVTSIAVGAGGTGYTSVPTVTLSEGVWANQEDEEAGLAALSDETRAAVRSVKIVGRAIAYRLLADTREHGQEVAEWMGKAAIWERRARAHLHNLDPTDRRTGIQALRPVVVRASGRY